MELVGVSELSGSEGATIVAGVMEGLVAAPGSERIVSEADERALDVAGFKGKKGQTIALPRAAGGAVLLVGLGDEVSFESVRAASGSAIRKVRTAEAITLLAAVEIDGATKAVAEGSLLGAYEYLAYKTSEEDDVRCERLSVVGADTEQLTEAIVLGAATNRARDWVNTPAKDESPEEYANMIVAAASRAGVDTEVWGLSRIEEEGLGALLGVAAGSARDPRVVIMEYNPEAAETHLALVGKGITFDTGGLSIKSLANMEEMKDDMAGSAAVAAATLAIVELALPIRVTCITPLTDNAVGGNATRPGDVLRPMAGPTIEVTNTDAEGRLILADGLSLALRYEPDLVVDVATLTGAARVALGNDIAAVFSPYPEIASRVLEAASRAGEPFWQLPLHADYRKSLDSNIADIKNSPGVRYGSAIAAALFLSEYVGATPWAHLDIAGPARDRETTGERVKGASGFGVRTLVELGRGLVSD